MLHSRPAVVNYGGSTGVVVFYGANDGMLHAVNGNSTGTDAGDELWSFVPEEMLGKLNRLRTNSPEVRMPSTPATRRATPRDYFVDGPIGVYQSFAADGTVAQAIIFVGMRRGGRLLYAFDVTTPSRAVTALEEDAAEPVRYLGQTWSEPKVARIKGNTNPVLVLGAGYDAAAEDAEQSPGTTTMGNAIYVLDAVTGALLGTFATTRAVPADLAVIDSDFDGYIDRAYGVDLSGKVYRIDFELGHRQHASSLVDVHARRPLRRQRAAGASSSSAPTSSSRASFTALMLGSGDREKPLVSSNDDHFFELFDRNIGKGAAADGHLPTTVRATSPPRARLEHHRGRLLRRRSMSGREGGERRDLDRRRLVLRHQPTFHRRRRGAQLHRQPRHRQDLRDAALLRHADGEHARGRRPAADAGVRHRQHRQRQHRAEGRLRDRRSQPEALGHRGLARQAGHQGPAQPHLLVPGGQSLIVLTRSRGFTDLYRSAKLDSRRIVTIIAISRQSGEGATR